MGLNLIIPTQIDREKKIGTYNQNIVNSILTKGIVGGKTIRNQQGSLTSVSDVMEDEISVVLVPNKFDLMNSRDGLVQVANGVTSGYVYDKTRLTALKSILTEGNAASLLPVVAERNKERFSPSKYFHSRNEWRERFEASFIIMMPVRNLKFHKNLMKLNYFEARLEESILPKDFEHIFVPEAQAHMFTGIDPELITIVKTVNQEFTMLINDSIDSYAQNKRIELPAPDYVSAIDNFMEKNEGYYGLHIVRLACNSDVDDIEDIMREPVKLSSEQLDSIGISNRRPQIELKEEHPEPKITDRLLLQASELIEQHRKAQDERAQENSRKYFELKNKGIVTQDYGKAEDEGMEETGYDFIQKMTTLLPLMFPKLSLSLKLYGSNGRTFPFGAYLYEIENNLKSYIRSLEGLVQNTNTTITSLDQIDDILEETDVTKMLGNLKFIRNQYGLRSEEELWQKEISTELDRMRLHFITGEPLSKISTFQKVPILEIFEYFEIKKDKPIDVAIEEISATLRKIKEVFGEDSVVYITNLKNFNEKILSKIDEFRAQKRFTDLDIPTRYDSLNKCAYWHISSTSINNEDLGMMANKTLEVIRNKFGENSNEYKLSLAELKDSIRRRFWNTSEFLSKYALEWTNT